MVKMHPGYTQILFFSPLGSESYAVASFSTAPDDLNDQNDQNNHNPSVKALALSSPAG